MARIDWGTVRIQKTDNQVIAEIRLSERKVTIHMDENDSKTKVEVIAIDKIGQFADSSEDNLVEALQWLANGIPDRTIEEIQEVQMIPLIHGGKGEPRIYSDLNEILGLTEDE